MIEKLRLGKGRSDAGEAPLASASQLRFSGQYGYQPAAMAKPPRLHNLINSSRLCFVVQQHFKFNYHSPTQSTSCISSQNAGSMRPFARSLSSRCHLGSSLFRSTHNIETASTATAQKRGLFTNTATMSGSQKLKPAARVAGSRQDVW